jgi:rhodanese-related sulfurtransferase
MYAALVVALFLACPQSPAQFSGPGVDSSSAYSVPQTQLLQAEELNHLLQAAGPTRPLVLQVGSHVLFAQAHIPGSEYIGPGSQPEGLQQLQKRVATLPKKRSIVLYCGCCPWNHCPNVGPAYKLLHDMGFTNVKVLFLATNFGADWVGNGYRIEQGR